MKPLLQRLCIILAAAAGCGCADELFLRPKPEILRLPSDLGYAFDDIRLPTAAGGHVAIWHVRTPGPRKGIVVHVPGSVYNKSWYWIVLPAFVDAGWDVILMDYAGFGDSTGPATFDGTLESARVVFSYAQSQDPIVVGAGLSFGTAVLARVAVDYDLAACIFDGTLDLWQSLSLYAEQNGVDSPAFGALDALVQMELPADFDTRRWITQVAEPKLFIHSPDDRLNPFPGAWEIFLAGPEPKYFFAVQGNHAIELYSRPDVYRSIVNGWLDGVLQLGPPLDPAHRDFLNQQLGSYLHDLSTLPLMD